MQLNWSKCQGEVWCKLNFVTVEHQAFEHVDGVYVIWHGGPNPATVRVGQGTIRDQIKMNRTDSTVQSFASLGLFVTWASVPAQERNGVEAFLASRLHPKIPNYPQAAPIEVNLPWP
jgi:hypothetical protein